MVTSQIDTCITLRCPKYMNRMLSPNAVWHSYLLILWQSFYGKKREIVGENFGPFY